MAEEQRTDLLLINPSGRKKIYQELGSNLAAVEPPLWCRLIAGYVRDRGYSIEIVDAEAESLSPRQVAERIEDANPALVGIVAYGHQPSAATQQMVGARLTCEAISECGFEGPVLIMGGHVSALPERTLQEERVTYACKGEGPVTVLRLLEALSSEEEGFEEAIPGLVWWSDGRPIINSSAPLIEDLDRDLHGDVWDLLPMANYRAHNWQCFDDLSQRQPYASIYTSLGCPYQCSFCCINAPFETNRYRMRSPQKVVEEVAHLNATYGIKTFKIVDEMFVLNKRHVTEICTRLAELGLDLNIWAYARVDTVKPEILDTLRAGGIRWLALGIESGSSFVRDGAQKALKNDNIKDVVYQIQSAGIRVIGNYIFGLPDDTHETMRETLDLAKELNCEFANFYCAMAYPGSPLFDMAVAEGWKLPDSWEGFSQHSYECLPLPTRALGAEDVLRFRDEGFHEYFSDPRYLGMIKQTFGQDTHQHILEMAQSRLKRQIL